MQISVISMKVLMESIKSDKMVKGRGGLPLCRTAGRRENTAVFLADGLRDNSPAKRAKADAPSRDGAG